MDLMTVEVDHLRLRTRLANPMVKGFPFLPLDLVPLAANHHVGICPDEADAALQQGRLVKAIQAQAHARQECGHEQDGSFGSAIHA
jgi:hypothetical protein